MQVRSGGRDVALQSEIPEAWWPHAGAPPSELLGGSSSQQLENLLGLPALLAVILRLSQGAGMVPWKVYRGSQVDRELADDTPQYELLHNRPSGEGTPFTFKADGTGGVAGHGYACLEKVKSRGEVTGLIVRDSGKVKPKRKNGMLVFEDAERNGELLTPRQIIYVRGLALSGSPVGLSPIRAARLGILNGIRRQMFEHRYLTKNAQAGVVLSFPERMARDVAAEWVDMWNESHQGDDQFETAAIGGGATVTAMPISMKDAQFVDANAMTAEQVGAIYGMPRSFLNVGDNSPTAEDWRFFVTFGLGWILEAFAQALTADRDLFPLETNPKRRMIVEPVPEALLKPDIRTRYEAYKAARQAGWMTSNEIRALENMAPHSDGDVLQVIPVGGGPGGQTQPPNRDEMEQLMGELDAMLLNASREERAVLERAIDRGRDALARV